MKQIINFSQFVDSFSEQRKNQFSYEGKRALFDHLQDYEESTGEELELDIVGLCCEYTEYASFKELHTDYTSIKSMDELRDNTTVIEMEGGGLIIQQF